MTRHGAQLSFQIVSVITSLSYFNPNNNINLTKLLLCLNLVHSTTITVTRTTKFTHIITTH